MCQHCRRTKQIDLRRHNFQNRCDASFLKTKYVLCRQDPAATLKWQEFNLEAAVAKVKYRINCCRNSGVDAGSGLQGGLDEICVHSHDCIGVHGEAEKRKQFRLKGDVC